MVESHTSWYLNFKVKKMIIMIHEVIKELMLRYADIYESRI